MELYSTEEERYDTHPVLVRAIHPLFVGICTGDSFWGRKIWIVTDWACKWLVQPNHSTFLGWLQLGLLWFRDPACATSIATSVQWRRGACSDNYESLIQSAVLKQTADSRYTWLIGCSNVRTQVLLDISSQKITHKLNWSLTDWNLALRTTVSQFLSPLSNLLIVMMMMIYPRIEKKTYITTPLKPRAMSSIVVLGFI